LNELLLDLSDKIFISASRSVGTSKVKFLETELSSVSSVRGGIKDYRNSRGDQGSTLVSSTVMRMDAPYICLVNKLIYKGIAKIGRVAGGKTGIVPQPLLKFTNLPINKIILIYQSILNEVFYYYSFVDNRPRLIVVYWILRKSLAKTLATKLRLKSSRQVYLKFGINIKYRIPNTGVVIAFSRPSLAVSPNNFIGDPTTVFKYPLESFIGLKPRTANAFAMSGAKRPTSFGSNQEGASLRTSRACDRRIKVINAKLNEFRAPLLTDVPKRVYSTVAGSSSEA